ncbi:MAG: polysaccharide deacetylase family protein, partial [Deltaproteobacteria bacterium]|nr:polysaccharide deacetylase family protein [Deltaproteobacteria bacterium]
MLDNSDRPGRSSRLSSSDGGAFVFLDACGKRWPRLRLFMVVIGLLLFVAMILFAQTLLHPSSLTLPPAVQQLKSRLKSLQAKEQQPRHLAARPPWLNFVKGKAGSTSTFPFLAGQLESQPVIQSPLRKQQVARFAPVEEIRLGFYEGWDPASLDSLKANAATLTHLCPDWLMVEDGRGTLKGEPEQAVLDLVKEQGLVLLPRLRNMDAEGFWRPEAVEGLVNGPVARQDQFIASLLGKLKAMDAGGVIVEWEEVDPTYRDALTALLARMATAFHAEALQIWLSVPMGTGLNVFDLDALAQKVDRFVAMLHDENAEFDQPGPVASMEWFNGWLTTLIAYGEPAQWVLALGSYGYDWAQGEKEAEMVRFQDVMSRAGRSGLAPFDLRAPVYNPHFVYEDSGVAHTLWFLDAATFVNQLKLGRKHHVGGIAISRLGTEDPGIWDVLQLPSSAPHAAPDLAALETIRPGATIASIGKGSFITIEDERADGLRRITSETADDPDALVLERYEKFPSYLTINHQGRGPQDAAVITFDDGPDPAWTPKILDILKAKGVSATFFMVGANMEKNPEIVRRIVAEGHTVGVHTYTHPNIALVSEERAYLEFNATQHLLEAITGRSTILFRPPYNADTNPHDPEEIIPVQLAQKLGYITVTEDIDPEDWSKPGVEAMLANVKAGRLQGGSVVLLHDAGGDREQTVEALPKIIDYLRVRGDAVVPLPTLLGISAEQMMPMVPRDQRAMTRMVSKSGFTALHVMTEFFWAFMIVATALVVVRTLAVAWLAIRSRRTGDDGMPSGQTSPESCPPVSVLIAAYNEEKVIGQTLRSVLNTSYPGTIEVVVVDDGSRDNTAQIVTAMAEVDNRIHLLRQVNKGKATALQV